MVDAAPHLAVRGVEFAQRLQHGGCRYRGRDAGVERVHEGGETGTPQDTVDVEDLQVRKEVEEEHELATLAVRGAAHADASCGWGDESILTWAVDVLSQSIKVSAPGERTDMRSERLAAGGQDSPEEDVVALQQSAGPVVDQVRCPVEKRKSNLVNMTGDQGHGGEVAKREKRHDLTHHLAG